LVIPIGVSRFSLFGCAARFVFRLSVAGFSRKPLYEYRYERRNLNPIPNNIEFPEIIKAKPTDSDPDQRTGFSKFQITKRDSF